MIYLGEEISVTILTIRIGMYDNCQRLLGKLAPSELQGLARSHEWLLYYTGRVPVSNFEGVPTLTSCVDY